LTANAGAAALRRYRLALLAGSLPVIPGEYVRPATGRHYGVGVAGKLVLAGSGLGLYPAPDGFSSLLADTVENPDTGAFDTVAETGEDNTVDASVRKN